MDKKDEQTSQNSFPVDQPRTKHYSGIPLMSCGFFPSGELLVGGGGGNSNSGIPNALILLNVVTAPKLKVICRKTFEFSRNDDSCYSIGIHPKENVVVCGVNCLEPESNERKSCRTFEIRDDDIIPLKFYQVQVDGGQEDEDNYQRLMRFTPEGEVLATLDLSGKVSLWKWPTMVKLNMQPNVEKVVDLSFNEGGEYIALTSPTGCSIRQISDVNSSFWDLKLEHICKNYVGSFCFGRFGTCQSKDILFIFINSKKSALNAKLIKVDYFKKKVLISKKFKIHVATTFSISPCGNYLALTSTDLQIFILHTSDLSVLKKLKTPKSFALTSTAFSPKHPLLACCTVAGDVLAFNYKSKKKTSVFQPKNALLLLFCAILLLIPILIKFRFSSV